MHRGLEGISVINRGFFFNDKRETSQKEVKWQLFAKENTETKDLPEADLASIFSTEGKIV